MMDEPAPPRPVRGAALKELCAEDLEVYAKDDLAARILALEGEIVRTRDALARKDKGRAAAEAVFAALSAKDL